MLNMPEDLNLLEKLQEATTKDVDEERGSFKKGDKVLYNMLGGGLTVSDLTRTLGTKEHILRANHDGRVAEIVEAIGEAVARYSIMFEDGFIINDVAVSELKSVEEQIGTGDSRMRSWLSPGDRVQILSGEYTDLLGVVKGFAKGQIEVKLENDSVVYLDIADVKGVSNESKTNESYGTLDIEADIKQGISAEEIIGNIRARYSDIGHEQAREIYNAVKTGGVVDWSHRTSESKTNEAEDATQTMKPQEKPDLKAEDCNMEDLSDVDLEKAKGSSEESGNAIRQVDDKELVIEPDEVVTPKKESKLKETMKDYSHDQLECLKCGYVKKIPYFSGQTALCPKCKTHLVPTMSPSKVKQMVKKYGKDFESKIKEETEFTPSRAEVPKLSDEKLRKLYNNALRSLEYWEKDGTVPGKVETIRKAVGRYEEMMSDRGLTSAEESSEKKESKFSFMKKQDPLWLCSECHKTFRSTKGICENCQSENIERITEQFGVGFTKEVFQVAWKNTDTGEEESTRVMAFDKADARKEAERSNREITKVEGPITEEPRKEEENVPFDQKDESKLQEGQRDIDRQIDRGIGLLSEYGDDVTKVMDYLMSSPDKSPLNQEEWEEVERQIQSYVDSLEESKLQEYVRELVGEVPGIDAEERARLYQTIEDGDISNEWPSDEVMIDALSTKNVEMGATDIDDLDMGEIKAVYLKYILLPRARKATAAPLASESKLSEQEVEGVPEKGQTYSIHPTSGVNFPDGNFEVTDVSYRWTVRGDLAKHFRVVGDDRWWIAKFYGFRDAKESGLGEAKEIKPITAIEIVRSKVDPEAYNIRVVELPEGSIVILDSVSDREKAIERGKEFARQLNAKFLGIIDEKKVKEQQFDLSKLEDGELIAKYRKELAGIDWSKETGAGEVWGSDKYEKMARMSREIRKRGLEIGESKLKEQEEDTFQTIAKGITDRADADKLAKEKEGQVIQDEDDKSKFAVLVRAEQ